MYTAKNCYARVIVRLKLRAAPLAGTYLEDLSIKLRSGSLAIYVLAPGLTGTPRMVMVCRVPSCDGRCSAVGIPETCWRKPVRAMALFARPRDVVSALQRHFVTHLFVSISNHLNKVELLLPVMPAHMSLGM